MKNNRDHINVCICTYQRQKLLLNLLNKLQNQKTYDLFTYSIIIVDNDHNQSARYVVENFNLKSPINVSYYCEPEQNIALARNKAIKNLNGNLAALIDDDEFPTDMWLYYLYNTLKKYNFSGVLGPVQPIYEGIAPSWVIKGKFYEKPTHKTGFILNWKDTRTSNVLLSSDIFNSNDNLFNPKLGRGGEDKEFFNRMIKKGFVFGWCKEATVFETVQEVRYKRLFMLKRALLRGKTAIDYPNFNGLTIIKSLVAVSLYTLAMPFFLLAGHHRFMKFLVKDFEHLGVLLAVLGFDVIRQKYVMK